MRYPEHICNVLHRATHTEQCPPAVAQTHILEKYFKIMLP